MTGFGRGESTDPYYKLIVEIRSVNHRFKDVRFRMSSLFGPRETDIRKALDRHFKRGSFDVYITYNESGGHSSFDDLDHQKIKSYLSHVRAICEEEGVVLQVTAGEFLRPEFARGALTLKESKLHHLLDKALDQAINNLKEFRFEEGQALGEVLKEHQEEYERLLLSIEAQADQFEKRVKERILNKFQQFQERLEDRDGRFHQEVIYYLEKMDIHEEMNRIRAHLAKLKSILSGDMEVGRQINFLVQELNRETNTMGSKSSSIEVSQMMVEMKVQLEKMREQALNLE